MNKDWSKDRAVSYGQLRYVEIDFQNLLGSGQEGYVWKTDRNSAIKVFDRLANFERELRCYRLLQGLEINELDGFTIPELVDCDKELMVIEMSIVAPPFVLDFGKSYIGQRPDFSDEVMADYEAERQELFEGNWDLVQNVISSLRSIGIYYGDARPGNISCVDHPRAIRQK